VRLELITILLLGFALGIKHALEPDHIIAVSTIAGRSKSLFHSSLAGIFWGCGHAATLLLVGIVLIRFKLSLPDRLGMTLEFCVGVMLVYLGIRALGVNFKKETFEADRSGNAKVYRKSAIVGLIHGLAGSGALVLMCMSAVRTEWEGVLYMLVFGAGTIFSMLAFTSLIGIPFFLDKTGVRTRWTMQRLAGTTSALFGLYYMYNLGVTEGLFRMWIS